MESISTNAWLVPTVLVALLGVILQGIKAAWDLSISIKERKTAQETEVLNRVSTFLAFIDGMPIPDAQKTVLKVRLINEGLKFTNKDLLYFLKHNCPDIIQ